MTKYLKTKPGSLEEITIKILQEGPYDSEIKKAPSRHSQSKGKLLLEPKKDDMKHQPDVKKEATYQDVSPSLANKPVATDNIKKKKEEAAVNPYAVGMAAAMKQTGDKPPLKKSTITKAHDIAKSIEKNEELKGNQKKLDKNHNGKLDADDFKKLRNEEDEDTDKMNKKQKDTKSEKEIIKIAKYEESKENINEAGMKEIDTEKKEMERLHTRLTQLRDAEKASAGADTTNIEKQINQTRLALLDLQKKSLERKENQEDVDADLINKKQKDSKGEKEIINKLKESKMNYKSYKKSLKKEQEDPKKMKSTMTGKPITKINTEPKLNKYN